jgi:hypothetical protein
LGEVLPSSRAAKLAIDAAVNVSLPSVEAQIAGLQLTIPIPSIAASLQLAQELVVNISAAIAAIQALFKTTP